MKRLLFFIFVFFILLLSHSVIASTSSTVKDYTEQRNYQLPTILQIYLKPLDEGGLDEKEIQFLDLLVELPRDRQEEYGKIIYKQKKVTSELLEEMSERLAASKKVSYFVGYWVNEDPNTNNITKIDIKEHNDLFEIYMWGKCHPIDCDWAEMIGNPATTTTNDASDGVLNIVWQFGFSIHTQELSLLSDGRLKVIGIADERRYYEYIEYFVKED